MGQWLFGFIVGIFIGAIVGVVVMSIFVVSGRNKDDDE